MIQDDKFNKAIASAYEQRQPYRDIHHAPVFLSFSAVPGSGKTTLAKRLCRDLHAQYVNHDDIRAIIKRRGIDPADIFMPDISRIITHRMFEHDQNKFVILDVSLDRRWDIFFDHAKEVGARTIVIRLSLPMDVIRERLRRRDGKNGGLLGELDRYKREFDNCCEHVTADITVGEEYDYDEVLDRIKKIISEKQS